MWLKIERESYKKRDRRKLPKKKDKRILQNNLTIRVKGNNNFIKLIMIPNNYTTGHSFDKNRPSYFFFW
jgi:hypothetical protein